MNKKIELKGSYVALVTPFQNRRLDIRTLRRLIRFHKENFTKGIVLCATTGEAPTVTQDEWKKILFTAMEEAKPSLQVIAYTGTNDTSITILKTKKAEEIGADACLVVTPYYNKPTQDGLFLHYKSVASSTSLPLILYNVPSRTGVSLEANTVMKLSEIKNIVGIKEASGNLDQVSNIVRLCGDNFSVLSGDDSLTLPILAVGGKGVVSVVANLFPRKVANIVSLFEKGDTEGAKEIHLRLFPLSKALFSETSPGPIKAIMKMSGLLKSDEMRLPLVNIRKETRENLRKILRELN